jgi:hypothetical protein
MCDECHKLLNVCQKPVKCVFDCVATEGILGLIAFLVAFFKNIIGVVFELH